MVTVKNIETFVRENDTDLRSFMVYKTHVRDRDLINESLQNFYVRLIESKALDSYDPAEGSFETYIINLFCWTLPALRKCFRKMGTISVAFIDNDSSHGGEEKDIWEGLQMNPYYRVDPSFSDILTQEDNDLDQEIEDFISYIKKTEKGKKAERMVEFIRRRKEGCNSADIAVMLHLTDNHVKGIKQEVTEKFKKWQKRDYWF